MSWLANFKYQEIGALLQSTWFPNQQETTSTFHWQEVLVCATKTAEQVSADGDVRCTYARTHTLQTLGEAKNKILKLPYEGETET